MSPKRFGSFCYRAKMLKNSLKYWNLLVNVYISKLPQIYARTCVSFFFESLIKFCCRNIFCWHVLAIVQCRMSACNLHDTDYGFCFRTEDLAIPIGSMVYLPTFIYIHLPKKSTIHVGKHTIVPWILWDWNSASKKSALPLKGCCGLFYWNQIWNTYVQWRLYLQDTFSVDLKGGAASNKLVERAAVFFSKQFFHSE